MWAWLGELMGVWGRRGAIGVSSGEGGGVCVDLFLRVGTLGGRGYAPFLSADGPESTGSFLMPRFLNARS